MLASLSGNADMVKGMLTGPRRTKVDKRDNVSITRIIYWSLQSCIYLFIGLLINCFYCIA